MSPYFRFQVDDTVQLRWPLETRVLLSAREVKLLDTLGSLREALPAHQVFVEVLAARSHPPHVKRDIGFHSSEGLMHIAIDHDRKLRVDLEARERPDGAASAESLLEPRAVVRELSGDEPQRQPAVAQFGAQLY